MNEGRRDNKILEIRCQKKEKKKRKKDTHSDESQTQRQVIWFLYRALKLSKEAKLHGYTTLISTTLNQSQMKQTLKKENEKEKII